MDWDKIERAAVHHARNSSKLHSRTQPSNNYNSNASIELGLDDRDARKSFSLSYDRGSPYRSRLADEERQKERGSSQELISTEDTYKMDGIVRGISEINTNMYQQSRKISSAEKSIQSHMEEVDALGRMHASSVGLSNKQFVGVIMYI